MKFIVPIILFFSIICFAQSELAIEEAESCVVEYDTVYVSYRETVELVYDGISTTGTTIMERSDMASSVVREEEFVAYSIYYEHRMLLYGYFVGTYRCQIQYYIEEVFRRIYLTVVVIENYDSPAFYGCPDTLVLLVPTDDTFIYIDVEDLNLYHVNVELVEYPEPYEGFWNFRYEEYGHSADLYFQFYPSIEDTGLYLFSIEASDRHYSTDCNFFVYVTKDTSQLCPYVEPETLYFEYLEGNPLAEEITIFDNFNIHHWHIDSDCESCIYPNRGVGTTESIVFPECKLNSIDVVFVIDTSGSMSPSLVAMRSSLIELVEMTDESMINIRYGIVKFADGVSITDFDYILDGYNMTNDPYIVIENLDSTGVTGGDDGPEVCLDAIALAVNSYDWDPNAIHHIILVTDAIYHERGDDSGFSSYIDSEIEDLLLSTNSIVSVFEDSYRDCPWYEHIAEVTGGQHYDNCEEFLPGYEFIIELFYEYRSSIDYFSEGYYECNLTYVIDYPITCRSINVPVFMHIYDSTETYQAFNCPDTEVVVSGICDTIRIGVDFKYCDSSYVNLLFYSLDHTDMWIFENREGLDSDTAMFILNPEESDTGLYCYCIEYGNEYGSDECVFFVRVLGQEPFYHFYEGWNLLSYPFTVPNTELITLNPDSVKPYTWNASDYTYELPDEITTADAFWLYSNCEMYYDIHYTTISEITTTLFAGWNMVSSTGDTLDIDVLTTHPEVVTPVYYYNTNAGEYEAATEMLPGIGYWLMSTETFEITYP